MMTFTCTIDGISLGVVEDLSGSKESGLTCFDDPDTDSNEQEFSDDNGAKKSYSIQGNYGANTWSQIAAWKNEVQSLITGCQYDESQNHTLVVYCPDENIYIEENINVMLDSFEYRLKGGESPTVSFTLKCYQSVPL